jgi:hypothetical protein
MIPVSYPPPRRPSADASHRIDYEEVWVTLRDDVHDYPAMKPYYEALT